LSYQRYDNLLLREDFCKLNHAAKILLGEAGSMLFHQLSRQRYDNLAAIGSAFFAKHFFGDAFTDAPVEQRQPRIDRDNNSSTCLGDELTLQPPALPEIISGTLAYMAPEQTGRVNRSIDARSDFYSFTLYLMLTGAQPFDVADPLEWVHCHIARWPTPPRDRAAVPEPLSAIVMKLLAASEQLALTRMLRGSQPRVNYHSLI
jgi:serine/threonine protein kinase